METLKSNKRKKLKVMKKFYLLESKNSKKLYHKLCLNSLNGIIITLYHFQFNSLITHLPPTKYILALMTFIPKKNGMY